MTNYFYINASGQKMGPVNKELLKELVAHGVIVRNTFVETDTGEQGTADRISGLFASLQPPVQSLPVLLDVPSQAVDPDKMIRIFRDLFFNIWMKVAGTFTCLALGIGAMAFDPEYVWLMIGVVFGFFIFSVELVVCTLMFLYRSWSMIPTNIATTTPGKAVGFLLIPFYNLYWVFIAFNNLGIDMNKTLQCRGIPYRVNDGLGLTACILFVGCAIPGIGMLISIPATIIMIRFLNSVKNGAIALLKQTES